MYCGKKRAVLSSPSLKEFLEALGIDTTNCSLPDDIKIQANTFDDFYIHFDKEQKIINIDSKQRIKQYGGSEKEDCKEFKCAHYDSNSGSCRCNSDNCINCEITDIGKLRIVNLEPIQCEDHSSKIDINIPLKSIDTISRSIYPSVNGVFTDSDIIDPNGMTEFQHKVLNSLFDIKLYLNKLINKEN